jgi:hypothetical protein
VAQDCSDIRLEQIKKFKTGYWMTTWTLNDLLVAFGVGVAFHQTLALDECVLAIRNSPLGVLRCALVNNQGSCQPGQHWTSIVWRRSESSANVRLVDPLGSLRLCRDIMELLTRDGYTLHPFDTRKRQRTAWTCGYESFFFTWGFSECADDTPLGDLPVRDMPQQFPKFVWRILTANAMNVTTRLVRVRADDLQFLRSGNVPAEFTASATEFIASATV